MAKKKKAAAPRPPRVATGSDISLPTSTSIETNSVGVSSVRTRAPRDERMIRPVRAGTESPLFRNGGEGFEAFCRSRGIDPRKRRFASEWASLLEEFNNRPIHGHRRGPLGGDHRPNRKDIRR